ncbi:MAG: cyclic nucleotide-binding domain-containing protein [Xanthomonadales bacterium]|nr:cyclic nucleotide-binding domain-containing protein [Xanthomonadales bacterium]
MKDIGHIISEHAFFSDLPERYCKLIGGCGKAEVFEPGQFLFKTGNKATQFFLVRHGQVALELHAPGKDVFRFQTIGHGGIVGWSWLFPPFTYMFDARAIEQTRVVTFDGLCLRGKCEEDHELGYRVIKRFANVMSRRLVETRLQLIDVYGRE